MRLTLNDAKGRAMSDKRGKALAFLKEGGEVTNKQVLLVFKDLGLQISWKLVFLIEYFGPILITACLVAFQKQIYGKTSEYTLN